MLSPLVGKRLYDKAQEQRDTRTDKGCSHCVFHSIASTPDVVQKPNHTVNVAGIAPMC